MTKAQAVDGTVFTASATGAGGRGAWGAALPGG